MIKILHSRTTPSRYVALPQEFLGRASIVVQSVGRDMMSWWLTLLEVLLFGNRYARLTRILVTPIFASHIDSVGPQFNSDFYLQQIKNEKRRRAASGAAVLHYIIFGTRESRSAHPSFDVAFYRRNNPEQSVGLDPFLHYLRYGQNKEPRNEWERGASDCWRPSAEAILTINHARGGGSSKFLALYERHLSEKGHNVLRMRAVTGAAHLGVLDRRFDVRRLRSEVVFDLVEGRGRFVECARALGVRRLLVNHVIDRAPGVFDWIREISSILSCPYDVVLHDYFALCPRVDLVRGDGACCNIAPIETCNSCVAKYRSEVHDVDVEMWRKRSVAFISDADKVIAPSADLAFRMRSYLPSKSIEVWNPENCDKLLPELIPKLRRDEPLRVVILGAVNVPKGARVVHAVATQALLVHAPIRFTIVGPSPETEALRQVNVQVTGAYRPENEDALIGAYSPHVAFVPAIWPETWSFVLSTILKHRLPVIAFDTGAPADRLRSLRRGHLIPLTMASRPRALLEVLLQLRTAWMQ